MKITVIGTGYVGLVAGVGYADMGNFVICVDSDVEKIEKLSKGEVSIYEPGLEELVKSNIKENRLRFSTDIENAIKESDVCFIAVGTPQNSDGSSDINAVIDVAQKIGKSINGYKIIVNKSTVPVGTAEKISQIIKENMNSNYDFDVVSNPEFLKQGSAVEDFLYPDRVIIGSDSKRATAVMKEIYAPFFRTGNKIIIMDVKSAEMTKYAANSFLATKISFMNEIANLCEKVGADAEMVRVGVSADSRIGNKFLFHGLGFGGSCFPKDIKALIKAGSEYGVEMNIIKAVEKVNNMQRDLFVKKIIKKFGNDLSNKTFGVWGLSFKPKTDDMREAPSVSIINALIDMGAKINAYDPKAVQNAKKIFKDKITYSKSSYEALIDADALLLLTEWNEFRHPDFEKIKLLLKHPLIFDGRNQYNSENLKQKGFEYICMGNKTN